MWRKGSLAVASPSRAKYANPLKGAHDPHGSEVQELPHTRAQIDRMPFVPFFFLTTNLELHTKGTPDFSVTGCRLLVTFIAHADLFPPIIIPSSFPPELEKV